MSKYFKNIFIMIFIVFTNILMAEVSIDSVVYNEDQSNLRFYFDNAVQYDNIILSGITFVTDDGQVNLGDGATVKSLANGNIIDISLFFEKDVFGDIESIDDIAYVLSIEQKDALERAGDKDNISVLIDENVFIDLNSNGNESIIVDDNLKLTYIRKNPVLELVSASYNASTNILSLTFNDSVNVTVNPILYNQKADTLFHKYFDYRKVCIAGYKLAISGHKLLTDGNDHTVEIKVKKSDQKALEALDLSNAEVNVNGAFRDLGYNMSNDNIVQLAFTPDSFPLEVVSAQYDASLNELTIQFNEKILAPQNTEYFFPAGITISDGGQNEDVTLIGYNAVGLRDDDTSLWLMVPLANQKAIETTLDTSNLKIKINSFTTLDENGNGNIEEDNLELPYLPDTEPLEIDMDASEYDASTNKLVLAFNDRLDNKVDFYYQGITLKDAASQTDLISLGIVDDLEYEFKRQEIIIDIPYEIEGIIENFSQIQIILEPFIVVKKNGNNGNPAVTDKDNKILTLIEDLTGPIVQSLQYDFKEGILIISFDEAVNFESLDPQKLEFAGIVFDNAGEVVDTVNSEKLQYRVSDAVKSALNEIVDSIKISPKFSFDQAMIKNVSGIDNEEIINGQDGDDYLVGYGHYFWTLGKEVFPSDPQYNFASIRQAGAHSEFYVVDDEWSNGNVTSEDVDSLKNAFEIGLANSPMDDSLKVGGIYNLVTKLFGSPPDYDNNGKVTILLYDILDEYDEGRNDANDKIYNPGYIEEGDQQSTEENSTSNEGDIIYIETNPQHVVPTGSDDQFATSTNALVHVFQKLVALKNNVNEEPWLIEGFSGLCQFFATGEYELFMEDDKISSTPNNDLTFFISTFANRENQKNAYLFNLYMYEKYGLDYIKRLDAYKGRTGMERIQWVLENGLDVNATVDDIFQNYSIACLFDKIEYNPQDSSEVTEHQYGFINADISAKGMLSLPPLEFLRENVNVTKAINSWSFNYYTIQGYRVDEVTEANPGLQNDSKVNINANDAAKFNVVGATQDVPLLGTIIKDFYLTEATLDEKNEGSISLQFADNGDTLTFRDNYRILVVIIANTSSNSGNIAFSNDYTKPDFASLSVVKNALIDRYLDIFLTSNESLYNDLSDGPSIELVLSKKDTIALKVERMFDEGSRVDAYIYRTNYEFNKAGNYEIIGSARDLSGNEIEVDKGVIAVAKPNLSGNTLLRMDNGFLVSFKDNSLIDKDFVYAVKLSERNLIREPNGDGISDVYQIMAEQRSGEKFFINIPYDETGLIFSENSIGLYYLNGDSWDPVNGTIDKKRNLVFAEVENKGLYQLRKGDSYLVELPEKFTLYQNYPNPFNPETNIRFSIPEQTLVQITIYNILGEQVKVFDKKEFNPGFHTILWNGKDNANLWVASGIYFYSIAAGKQVMTKKMILVK